MLPQINPGLNWNLNGILNYYYKWQKTMAVRDRVRKWIGKINLQKNIQVFGCPSQCWFSYYEGKEQYQTNQTLPRKGHASKPPNWTKRTFIVFLWRFFVLVTKCFLQSILFCVQQKSQRFGMTWGWINDDRSYSYFWRETCLQMKEGKAVQNTRK